MIAGANEISQSSVGLVYFCAIFPTLLVKLTGPYWWGFPPHDHTMTYMTSKPNLRSSGYQSLQQDYLIASWHCSSHTHYIHA